MSNSSSSTSNYDDTQQLIGRGRGSSAGSKSPEDRYEMITIHPASEDDVIHGAIKAEIHSAAELGTVTTVTRGYTNYGHDPESSDALSRSNEEITELNDPPSEFPKPSHYSPKYLSDFPKPSSDLFKLSSDLPKHSSDSPKHPSDLIKSASDLSEPFSDLPKQTIPRKREFRTAEQREMSRRHWAILRDSVVRRKRARFTFGVVDEDDQNEGRPSGAKKSTFNPDPGAEDDLLPPDNGSLYIRTVIPYLPRGTAAFCLILNIIIPGSGNLI